MILLKKYRCRLISDAITEQRSRKVLPSVPQMRRAACRNTTRTMQQTTGGVCFLKFVQTEMQKKLRISHGCIEQGKVFFCKYRHRITLCTAFPVRNRRACASAQFPGNRIISSKVRRLSSRKLKTQSRFGSAASFETRICSFQNAEFQLGQIIRKKMNFLSFKD